MKKAFGLVLASLMMAISAQAAPKKGASGSFHPQAFYFGGDFGVNMNFGTGGGLNLYTIRGGLYFASNVSGALEFGFVPAVASTGLLFGLDVMIEDIGTRGFNLGPKLAVTVFTGAASGAALFSFGPRAEYLFEISNKFSIGPATEVQLYVGSGAATVGMSLMSVLKYEL